MNSIVEEIRQLHLEENIKEVTLLGQNVNSYHDRSEAALVAKPNGTYRMSNEGFRSRVRRNDAGYFFADLLDAVSDISTELRVRFTSPHPKDFPQHKGLQHRDRITRYPLGRNTEASVSETSNPFGSLT